MRSDGSRSWCRWKLRANGFLFGALVVFLISHFFGGDTGLNGFIRAALRRPR